MNRRVAGIVLALLAVALIAPSIAFAGPSAPQLGRVIVNNYDFEPAGTSGTVAKLDPAEAWWGATTAWWGNVAGRGYNATTGLWCAGSPVRDPMPANYPGGATRGVANFAVSATSDFYISDFSFRYRYPTTSSTSETLFESPAWYDEDPATHSRDFAFGDPPYLTSNWVQQSYNRTGGAGDMFTSAAGWVQFTFDVKGSGGTAEGPTLDDVQVTGYKYGPVRNLSATRLSPTSTTLSLSWDAPVRIPNTTLVDTRSIRYRIWRWTPGSYVLLDDVVTTYGHVTTQDTGAPDNKELRYIVQAYDPNSDSLWGQHVVSATIPSLVKDPLIFNVYRYRNLKGGFYLWSRDEAEKTNIIDNLWRTWRYEGVAYRIDAATSPTPLWRFRNKNNGSYFYTADPNEKTDIGINLGNVWVLEGEAYKISLDPSGSPVWRFLNLKSKTHLYTADPNEKNNIVVNMKSTWRLEGPAFYLAW